MAVYKIDQEIPGEITVTSDFFEDGIYYYDDLSAASVVGIIEDLSDLLAAAYKKFGDVDCVDFIGFKDNLRTRIQNAAMSKYDE